MAESDKSDVSNLNRISKVDGRVLRSRQYKRPFDDNRPIKRLFTPEIKRHLKTWLIRRRENPYPNREEKKELAAQTGLTYIQICNWFANWRRKLKNSGKNINKFTWSTLIKSYNDQILGNVEHLSISSDDSIWEEPDSAQSKQLQTERISHKTRSIDHCYTFPHNSTQNAHDINKSYEKYFLEEKITNNSVKEESLPQCFQISSTTDFIKEQNKIGKKKNVTMYNKSCRSNEKIFHQYLVNKRKKSVSNKNWNYRRMIEEFRVNSNHIIYSKKFQMQSDPSLLSKWKKSAALFQPSCKTYTSTAQSDKRTRHFLNQNYNFHGREELDAAEALTFLSRASVNSL